MRTPTFTPATKSQATKPVNDSKLVPLNTSILLSNQPYQRQISKSFVASRAQAFNANKVNPIKVSYRDGKYYVIDGQHTIAICKVHNGNKDCIVPCQILYGLTYDEEVKLYNERDKDRHDMNSAEQWVGLAAEKSSEVMGCINATLRAGCELGYEPTKRGKKINRITALVAAKNAYDTLGERMYIKTITLLRTTYKGNPRAFSKQMLDGMKAFMGLYGKEIDETLFISNISRVSPEEIERIANSDKLSRSQEIRVAKTIYTLYNYKQRSKKLPSKFEY